MNRLTTSQAKYFLVPLITFLVFVRVGGGAESNAFLKRESKVKAKIELLECEEVSVEELDQRWRRMNGELAFVLQSQAKLTKEANEVSTTMQSEKLRKEACQFRSSMLAYTKLRGKSRRKKKGKTKSRRKTKRNREAGKNGKGKGKKLEKEEETGHDQEIASIPRIFTNSNPMNRDGFQCFMKGSADHQGLLRLCTECVGEKVLDASSFPNRLTEVTCSTTDNNCLLGDGKCSQRYATVVVLQRTEKCITCNGIRKRQWVPEVLSLKVGCSCRLRPGSIFSLLM